MKRNTHAARTARSGPSGLGSATGAFIGTMLLAGLTLSACGGPANSNIDWGATTYAPVAYGQTVNGTGRCYYVDSPLEVTAPGGLLARGLCPVGWVATPMPLSWHEEYYAYYDSTAYYDTYVPVSLRASYVRTQTPFGRTYSVQIRTTQRLATYRSSTGGKVAGNQLGGKVSFGPGTAFGTTGQRFGGGSARTSKAPAPAVVATRAPTTGRLFGGGSARRWSN